MCGVYRVWGRGLCGHEISYMSTVGAKCGAILGAMILVTHALFLAMSGMGIIMLCYINNP
jgi:hypothetical protein